jgi:YD repeat-containing protein
VYTYDPLHRLESAAGKYGAIGYAYDEVGNRTQQTVSRAGQLTTETYIYPLTNNRLDRIDIQPGTGPLKQRRFIYDNAGNLLDETRADGSHRRSHYDNTNRMDSVAP